MVLLVVADRNPVRCRRRVGLADPYARRGRLGTERLATVLAGDGEQRRERCRARRAAAEHRAAAHRTRLIHLIFELLEPATSAATAEADRDPVAEHFAALLAEPVGGFAHRPTVAGERCRSRQFQPGPGWVQFLPPHGRRQRSGARRHAPRHVPLPRGRVMHAAAPDPPDPFPPLLEEASIPQVDDLARAAGTSRVLRQGDRTKR